MSNDHAQLETNLLSQEAEMSVLGASLMDSLALDKAMSSLSYEDFSNERHRGIFQVMQTLVNKSQAVDLVTTVTTLKEKGQLNNCGGAAYLAELIDYVPTTANVDFYIKKVKETAVLRRLMAIGRNIPNIIAEDIDPDISLEKIESQVFALRETASESNCSKISSSATEILNQWNQAALSPGEPPGLRSGFSNFDLLTGGLEPGNLYLIAARPGVGKTALAMTIAARVSVDRKHPTLFFSLEMSSQQLAGRILSSIGSIDSARARIGRLREDEYRRLVLAQETLQEAPLFIDDTAATPISEIRYKARKMKHSEDIQLIIIDYLQLVTAPLGKGASREAEVSTVSRGLKALARELKVPVIALCQLNRGLENRVDKRPMLSDLRESGSLEQDADVVGFLHKPGLYDKNIDPAAVDLLLGKNRHGPLGQVNLEFIAQSGRFTQISRQT